MDRRNASWRWIFLVNVPVAVVVLAVAVRHVPESRDPQAARGFDVLGAALGAVGLAGVTFALIEAGSIPPRTSRLRQPSGSWPW